MDSIGQMCCHYVCISLRKYFPFFFPLRVFNVVRPNSIISENRQTGGAKKHTYQRISYGDRNSKPSSPAKALKA